MSESISQLPAASQANLTDLIPATQGSIGPGTGTTRGVTLSQQQIAMSADLGTGLVVVGGGASAPPATIANGQLPATATNDAGAAGKVGEYISATVLAGSAVSITNNTAANVASISLTAGDWDVSGTVSSKVAGSTVMTTLYGWISATSATLPTSPNSGAYANWAGSVTGGDVTLATGTIRISIASTTTIYLGAQSGFSVSTNASYGFIGARRAR